ncbi:nucleotide sugar dehydrogenase [Wohlfahrtiimonas sp. G9077]|uniref:nucleotide sugar dehydrogenase n=1 Tax=Wohlfahrtiimonas sp. G9077 TaxID=1980118 RepID=UPI000B98EFBB|nr:nucleotide sugar dehydrogenase [Wohlfahrtiimonas sp. G9077]OYQ72528.1 UDP-glucose 6-dehydrogenase [Wohlfahrtiimonas sp. G9077]
MKITVVGTGYVGLSNAMLFSKKHNVIALDIDEDKVNQLNAKISPIQDGLIQEYLEVTTSFQATLSEDLAYKDPDIVIIATPTNYDEQRNFFDTSSIEQVLSNLSSRKCKAKIVIKSTIPVGFTEKVKKQYPSLTIVFSPEFLREGKALYDNLYPSRIVIGDKTEIGREIGDLFCEACLKDSVEVLLLNPTEAEAVKLFSNTYLAMRVAYFNELDSYCESRHLNSKDVIRAVCLDPRIGNHYNNPSFGYGGYCLPKDTKQLLANYQDVPQNLIEAIISSNRTRKDFITNQILKHNPKVVGVYRLIMKQGSDNFRKSAIQSIMKRLHIHGINLIIFEPNIQTHSFNGFDIITDLNEFKTMSDLVITNRMTDDLLDIQEKVYTRDLFGSD